MSKLYRLLFLFLLPAFGAVAQAPFKILSYNILEGMKTDTTKGKQEFVAWVKDKDPDILALQECNGFTQKTLEELAASYGHPYAVIVKENGYPTGLTSKYPIAAIQKVNENMTHGFIMAKIEQFNILVLHLNPHLYKKRRAEIAQVIKNISLQADKKNWVIMGDFNSHSPKDKERMTNNRIVGVLKNAETKNPKIANLVNGETIDFTIQQAMLDAGFTDAGLYHHDKTKAATGKGVIVTDSRIDYIYVSKDLDKKLQRCAFIYDDFTKKYSDHRPIMMELKN
ncbi:endonuclease/exonuclease/phosphatase family protein [Chitinophaga horti]|uniref:Endonuclease/exonuclease/phosphatase family protein n=1 Tax=Chitinophaga horti TaxID=2920382 RepID=A0ABY6J7V4_9BACT|nr:endonuclease/exonuclease/phosphatase family protein [Chitinophaga horti]UYQ95768.1 endonuclease/exonuclease/phosphatase family protein [Chitinophaga horti]